MRALQASKSRGAVRRKGSAIWNTIAASLWILFEDGTTREYEDQRRTDHHQTGRRHPLAHLLGLVNNTEEIRRDLAYYEPRIDAGSGPCSIPILLCNTPGWVTVGKPTSSSLLAQLPAQPRGSAWRDGRIRRYGQLRYFRHGAGGMLQLQSTDSAGWKSRIKGIRQRLRRCPHTGNGDRKRRRTRTQELYERKSLIFMRKTAFIAWFP